MQKGTSVFSLLRGPFYLIALNVLTRLGFPSKITSCSLSHSGLAHFQHAVIMNSSFDASEIDHPNCRLIIKATKEGVGQEVGATSQIVDI